MDIITLEDWLRGGVAPKMLIGEIGALISHAGVAIAVKEQLSNVRTWLNRRIDRLQEPSCWKGTKICATVSRAGAGLDVCTCKLCCENKPHYFALDH